jgi:hypothetical protein
MGWTPLSCGHRALKERWLAADAQVRGNAAVTATDGLPASSIADPWRTGLPMATLGILGQRWAWTVACDS